MPIAVTSPHDIERWARYRLILRVLGQLLMALSLALVIPMAISIGYDDGELVHFLTAFGLTFGAGAILWLAGHGVTAELRTRDGFLVVSLFWLVLGALSGLPFILGPHLSFTDSLFEAVSAFTTTGATVIVGLDQLPASILWYRQQLQWLGGMGIIVLGVAVLPMLGIGGMQLYRAETPGPMKDEKLAPRIADTARFLWLLYLGLTLACAAGYRLAGMSLFDAIGHSFATVSTGGFSTHDASMAYFHSPLAETVAIVFMLLGGMNFAVHYQVVRGRDPRAWLRDVEVRTFVSVTAAVTAATALTLWLRGAYPDPLTSLRDAAFQVASVITSTGFTTTDFSLWPLFLPLLLMLISFVGGCGGSTAGGMKVMRFVLLFQQSRREVRRLIYPRAIVPVKIGGRVVDQRIIRSVWGFFAVYVSLFVLLMLGLMATGLDQVTAFGAIATCMNNLGPGLGEVAGNFTTVNPVAKWLCTLAMLLGRLEIFTLLVLLSPAYWRR
ncbi:MAG: TrkH family potassium uptake protein [Gammaproteobacteria bacterium]|nr:TrkH family potassium uptake protein [Gammaproteobacteria bacterium]